MRSTSRLRQSTAIGGWLSRGCCADCAEETRVKPERWAQIERLYQAAVERDPESRAAFLDEACKGDEELRLEVASLLAYDDQVGSFIEAPVLEVAAAEL